jgi:DNA-binding transcriptional ArsR family regulator
VRPLGEELSVGELSEIMQAGQPGVSRHLSSLRDAGLVVARKQGATTYYRIQPGDPPSWGQWGPSLPPIDRFRARTGHIERIVARRRARAEAFFDEQAES